MVLARLYKKVVALSEENREDIGSQYVTDLAQKLVTV